MRERGLEGEEVTALLERWRGGDVGAGDRLIDVVYDELRRLASYYLRQERVGHTLEPTALVHEFWLRISDSVAIQNRAHLFAIAAQQLRRILIDHARKQHAGRRGGGAMKVTLSAVHEWDGPDESDILLVNEALERLSALEPRAASVVEMRFFGGLNEQETADALAVSLSTVKRDWRFARAWLYTELAGSAGDG